MSTDSPSEDISIGYLLKKTQHALRLQMDEELKKMNLTTPQYAVLAHLEKEKGISNAQLARRSFITAQTMHGIVSNLEGRGLVKRFKDPNHGRVLCTQITTKGLTSLKNAHIVIQKTEKQMMASISSKNQSVLKHLLSECLASLAKLK